MREDQMEINIASGHVDEISYDSDNDVCEGIEVNICQSSDQTRAGKKASKSSTASNSRQQKYRNESELKPEFSKGLSCAKEDTTGTQAFCKICKYKIQARLGNYLCACQKHKTCFDYGNVNSKFKGTSIIFTFTFIRD